MFPYTYSSSTTTTTATTTTSTLEGSFLHFPWPFLDDVDEYDMLCQEHQNLVMNSSPLPGHDKVDVPSSEANMMMSNGDGVEPLKGLVGVREKRTGKNDRHSKIRTAQGLRDRRMRLSVKVARRFFDLQDMLDFDKASKTIEWLLKNSEPAIQELLARNNKCMSSSEHSLSEEVVSETHKEMEVMQIAEEPLVGSKPREKRKRRRRCCKTAPVNPLAKEIRDKARARARERTRERLTMLETSKHRLEDGGDSAAAPNQNLEFPGRHAMKSKRTSLGNAQVQNIENEVFSTNPNCQEHSSNPHPSSIFMTNSNGEQWNPSSGFGTTPITQDDQNPIPNSIFKNINALELGIPPQYSQLSIPNFWETIFCNPILK